MTYILLILGFLLLVKGADVLVDGASSLARKFNISDLVIGLTIVALGTSAPELFVNVIAIINGNSQIAMGNILGSNIANVFLVLGISAIVAPLYVKKGIVYREIPFSLFAALFLVFLLSGVIFAGAASDAISQVDGILLLGCFTCFMYYVFVISKKKDDIPAEVSRKEYSLTKSIGMILVGLVGLGFGGKLIVDCAVIIASAFGVSESFIGLTIVAIGTSLPEVATSAVAAYKGKPEIAVGNVVGSNIFNIFFVLGISALIAPIPFYSANTINLVVLILSNIILFVCMFTGKRQKIDRWEGILFILLYLAYLLFLIFRGLL